jgi:ribosome-associated protein
MDCAVPLQSGVALRQQLDHNPVTMAKKAAKKAIQQQPQKTREEEMAFAAATYADDKKAEDIVIMDVQGISPVADHFVICTATSMPHLRSIRNEIKDRFWLEHGRKPIAVDEKMESLWIILHYGDVMVHIFHQEKRDFYALEELWGDAPRVAWAPQPSPAQIAQEAEASVKKKAVKKAAVKKPATKKTAVKKAAAKKVPAKKAARKKSA